MAETNRFQLVVAEEAQPGVAISDASLYVAANATLLPTTAPQISLQTEGIQRSAVRPSLTPLTTLPGVPNYSLTVTVEMAGDTTGTPSWSALMQACGWRSYTLSSYTIGAITGGPFYAGEALTGSTGTGTCLFDTFNGQTTLYTYEDGSLTGTATGGTSGATGAVSSPTADAGTCWVPVDDYLSQVDITGVTGTIDAGDVLVGDTSGARIVTTEAWTNGSDRGFRYLSGTLTEGEDMTNASQTGAATLTSSTIEQVQMKSLTVAVIEDGVRRKLYGCRGTVSFATAGVGEPMVATFELVGLGSTPTEGGPIQGVTRTNHVPVGFRGVTFLVGDDADAYADEHSPRAQSFSITIGGDIGLTKDATTASGLSSDAAKIRTRTASADMTVGLQSEQLFDFISKTDAATPFRINCIFPSTKTANTLWYHLPAFTPTTVDGADDAGDALRSISGDISGRRPDGSEGDQRELIIALLDAAP
jgi:hypothetical protein